MANERHVEVLQHRPDRIHFGMGRGAIGWRGRRHPNRRASITDRLFDLAHGHCGIVERDERHAPQPPVVGAEVGHPTVQRARTAVENFRVEEFLDAHIAPELGRRHALEHQLPVVAQQIERPAPFAGIDSAQGMPTLAFQDVGFSARHRGRIVSALLQDRRQCGHQLFGGGSSAHGEVDGSQFGPHLGISVPEQPILGFHDVTVSVVVNSALGIWHLKTPVRRFS